MLRKGYSRPEIVWLPCFTLVARQAGVRGWAECPGVPSEGSVTAEMLPLVGDPGGQRPDGATHQDPSSHCVPGLGRMAGR